jgi:multiple antibiotic resistance protein
MLEQFLSLSLATVASLLPIANPFSTAPIFLSLTRSMSAQEKRRIARRTSLYLFFILTASFLAGTLIMRFFGISIPGLRIAGGILIMKFGLSSMGGSSSDTASDGEKSDARDIAFTPLAIPSLSGPGAIAATISLASVVDAPIDYPAAILGILILAVVSFIILSQSYRITKFLGEDGMNILVNIMGFIILCIGVQFVVDGVVEVVNTQLSS